VLPDEGAASLALGGVGALPSVSFAHTRAGTYRLGVQIAGDDISGSPFELSVLPDAPVATAAALAGGALTAATAGMPCEFRVVVRDRFGNDYTPDPFGDIPSFSASVQSTNKGHAGSGGPVDVRAAGFAAGGFAFAFEVTAAGSYALSVAHGGVDVAAANVSVAPAAIDAAQSASWASAARAAPGDALEVLVVAVDRFGNAPPPPLRTNRTRRVPHPVLIGHAASLSQATT